MPSPRWVCLILTLLLAAPGAAQNLRLATTEQLAPFVPVVDQVLRRAGVSAVYERLPQVRVYASLKTHLVDGAFFLAEVGLQEVPGMQFVPVVLYRNEYVAVALRPDVVVRSLDDLQRYTVAIERGNSAQELLVKDHRRVTKTPDQKTEFLMLAAGRVDVALASRAAAPSLIEAAAIPQAVIQEPALLSQPLYLGLTGPGLLQMAPLTRAFRSAVEDGSWNRAVAEVFAKLVPRP